MNRAIRISQVGRGVKAGVVIADPQETPAIGTARAMLAIELLGNRMAGSHGVPVINRKVRFEVHPREITHHVGVGGRPLQFKQIDIKSIGEPGAKESKEAPGILTIEDEPAQRRVVHKSARPTAVVLPGPIIVHFGIGKCLVGDGRRKQTRLGSQTPQIDAAAHGPGILVCDHIDAVAQAAVIQVIGDGQEYPPTSLHHLVADDQAAARQRDVGIPRQKCPIGHDGGTGLRAQRADPGVIRAARLEVIRPDRASHRRYNAVSHEALIRLVEGPAEPRRRPGAGKIDRVNRADLAEVRQALQFGQTGRPQQISRIQVQLAIGRRGMGVIGADGQAQRIQQQAAEHIQRVADIQVGAAQAQVLNPRRGLRHKIAVNHRHCVQSRHPTRRHIRPTPAPCLYLPFHPRQKRSRQIADRHGAVGAAQVSIAHRRYDYRVGGSHKMVGRA